jgi:hypothetical protein
MRAGVSTSSRRIPIEAGAGQVIARPGRLAAGERGDDHDFIAGLEQRGQIAIGLIAIDEQRCAPDPLMSSMMRKRIPGWRSRSRVSSSSVALGLGGAAWPVYDSSGLNQHAHRSRRSLR